MLVAECPTEWLEGHFRLICLLIADGRVKGRLFSSEPGIRGVRPGAHQVRPEAQEFHIRYELAQAYYVKTFIYLRKRKALLDILRYESRPPSVPRK